MATIVTKSSLAKRHLEAMLLASEIGENLRRMYRPHNALAKPKDIVGPFKLVAAGRDRKVGQYVLSVGRGTKDDWERYQFAQVKALYLQGIPHFKKGNFAEAEKFDRQALDILIKIGATGCRK